MKISTITRNWPVFATVVGLLLIWQLAASFIRLPLILPTPSATFNQLKLLLAASKFWHHLGASIGRGVTGFGVSLVTGLILGLLAGRSAWLGRLLRPLIVIMRSTPVMSVIILALIWFRRETVPIFVTFLMVFPIIIQNIIEGLQNIPSEFEELVQVYQVSKWRRVYSLYLPALLPYLAAGISSGLGITWKVLIAAEVLAYPTWGIGSQLDSARVYLQTDLVFAWTVIVILIGLTFDYLIDYLLRKPFASWKVNNHDQA